MSGNIKTINRSNQKDNIIFEKWHEQIHGSRHNEHHKFHIDDKRKFLLLGTPNVGKSTFFNKITTATAMVSNIDRMTVQNTVGRFRNDKSYCLVDLPGVYNLSHPLDEEMVVAHEIFHENFLKIANIVGAQSIERDLILTIQCLETGMLSTVMVNMIDEISKNAINYKKMSKMLNNVTIIPTQANR
jgi:ferrous iron transport protein B